MDFLNETEFSCLDYDDLSRSTVTHEEWQIFETVRDGIPGVAAVMILYLLLAFSWNLFIIVSMLWKGLLRQPAHLLLFNLAITDFLVSILVMPFTIVSGFAREYVFGSSDYQRCRVCQTGIILTLLSIVSLHNIALLSVDRFLLIARPLHYKKLVTVQRTVIALITVWVLCTLLSIPPLFGFGEVRLTTSVGNCLVSFSGETDVTMNIYYILLVLLEGLIPIGVLIVTNIWLVVIIQRHYTQTFNSIKVLAEPRRSRHRRTLRQIHRRHSRQQIQLLRVFGAIFIANFVTLLPSIALAAAALFVDFDLIPAEVIIFVYLTYLLQFVVHPILESLFILELRRLLLQLCTCGRKKLLLPHESIGDHRGGGNRRGSHENAEWSIDLRTISQRELVQAQTHTTEANGDLTRGSYPAYVDMSCSVNKSSAEADGELTRVLYFTYVDGTGAQVTSV